MDDLKKTPTRRGADNERGSVLVLTLMLTLVILGIGLMAMWMSSSATKVSGNLVRRQEAMQAARAGVQRAQTILLQLVGSGGTTNPNYSPALRGQNCTVPPASDAARVAAYTEGKGWILCAGTNTTTGIAQGAPLQNVPVISAASSTYSVAVSELDNVTFTAWVRNDDDEYRWCDGNQDHGETDNSDNCGGGGGAVDKQKRLLDDEDSRIILRVEARGRDGLSFAAIETVISGRIPISLQNLYTQSGGSGGQNSNAVILR